MKKDELIEKIAALSLELATRIIAYRDYTGSNDHTQNADHLMAGITAIEVQLAELNDQLTIIIAAEPTNGKEI
ncbi:MAG: hypothetical protein ABUT20_27110 [Bacteroidota bacterium]